MLALSLASSTTLAADLGVANNFSAFVFNDFKSNFGRADGAIAAGEIDLKGYSVGYTRPYNPEEYYLISESTIKAGAFKNPNHCLVNCIYLDIFRSIAPFLHRHRSVIRLLIYAYPFHLPQTQHQYNL